MFIFHLPTTAIGWVVDHFFAVEYFTSIGFRVSLFSVDILLLLILLQSFENHWKKVLIYYWLSPLVLFVTYWHGQTDLIPVVLFIYALTLIKRMNFKVAAVLFACSIAAKHSMIIGVPFVILYLWSHGGNQKEFQNFIRLFFGSLLFLSKIILFGENFSYPFNRQLSLGLSIFKVLLDIIIPSFLYLKKCVNLSDRELVIFFLFLLM